MGLSISIGNGDSQIDKNEIDQYGNILVRIGNLTTSKSLFIRADNFIKRIQLTDKNIKDGYVEDKINISNSISSGNVSISASLRENGPFDKQSFTIKNSFDTKEDISYVLKTNDIGIYGQKEVDGVQVKTLPQNGALTLSGVAVKVGDTVSKSDVESGNLKFTPVKDTDENGSFEFALVKGGVVGEKQTVTIDIEAVADMPNLEIKEATSSEGQGLEFTVYNDIYCQGLEACDLVKNSNILVPLANNLKGETKTIIGLNQGDIDCGTMMAAKGFIYLEQGQQVSFKGSIDDAALIRLEGKTLLYSRGDAYGNFDTSHDGVAWANKDTDGAFHTSGTFNVTQSGYYKLEAYMLNATGRGNHNIKMSVDGKEYKEINTDNFTIYSSGEALTAHANNAGIVSEEIKLSEIVASLNDTDGSETLHVNISNIPVGAVLSDGTNTFMATVNTTTVDVATWDLKNLSIKVPYGTNQALHVSATATEKSNGDSATIGNTKEFAIALSAVSGFDNSAVFIPKKCGYERDLQHDIDTVSSSRVSNYVVPGNNTNTSNISDDNDYIVIGDDIGSLYYKSPTVNTYGGNDVIKVGGAIDFDAKVNTGEGNDEIVVGLGGIIGRAKVDMGSDDDILSVKGTVGGMWYSTPEVDLGSGNDTMKVDGFINANARVNLGSGDDKLTVVDHFSINQNAKVDGGEGYDILALSRPGALVDLTRIAKHVDNMEELDVSSWHRTNVNLTVSDIIDMTDDKNTLKISGDSNDRVSNEKQWSWNSWSMQNKDHWEYQGSKDGYKEYKGTDVYGKTATLLVEDVVTVDF